MTAKLFVDGAVLDGNGWTITVENPNKNNHGIGVNAGGTLKNVTIVGETNANRKLFYAVYGSGLDNDVVIENCTLNGTYALNIQNGSDGAGDLIVKDSSLLGWTSYSLGSSYSAEFTNCTFGKGNTGYSYIKPSSHKATIFTNCVFEDGFKMGAASSAAGASIVLTNCTYNGTKVTANNVQSLLIDADSVVELKQCTITVDGKTVALAE